MRISRFFAVRALAAAALLAMPASAMAQGMPPIPVTVAEPLAKRITQWDEFHGRFEAVESVDVRARVSGFIDHVHFKDGQIVQAGDLLFTIDQRPFLLAAESARAEVARTAAQVELQDADLERATPLVRTGAITQREFDQRRNAVHAARAQLDVAKVNLKISELNLEWSQVRAPIGGRVSNRKIDAGNLVVGGQSGATLLTTIVALDPIYFVFDMSEADYLRYARLAEAGLRKSEREGGNPIRLRLGDEQVWSRVGSMDFIDNQMNARSGTVRGRAVVENKRHLLTPGLFGRGQLYGGELDALLVPDAAIVSDQTRKIIFTVGADNVVKAAQVTLGPIVDGLRVVTGGIKGDDRVVIDGLANPMVRPGTKVVPEAGKIVAATN